MRMALQFRIFYPSKVLYPPQFVWAQPFVFPPPFFEIRFPPFVKQIFRSSYKEHCFHLFLQSFQTGNEVAQKLCFWKPEFEACHGFSEPPGLVPGVFLGHCGLGVRFRQRQVLSSRMRLTRTHFYGVRLLTIEPPEARRVSEARFCNSPRKPFYKLN